jgi:hypothetical protein
MYDCGLVADNVGRVAVIVGQCSLLVAINLVPKVVLIAVSTVFDCAPLHISKRGKLMRIQAFIERCINRIILSYV